MGVKVTVVKSDMDYLDYFYKVRESGRFVGKYWGFPLGGMCTINKNLKVKPMTDYFKKFKKKYINYVGIAIDEPKRLEKIHKHESNFSILERYNYTEDMAYDLCKSHDLLSPIYKNTDRNGCWFCPNSRVGSLNLLSKRFPHLWDRLLLLDKEPRATGFFKYGKSVAYYDNKFKTVAKYKDIV